MRSPADMELGGVLSSRTPFRYLMVGKSILVYNLFQTPVSITDLGGTEIDLRFGNPSCGRLFVVVAPVPRFADYLEDDAKIEKIGTPEKVINAFGPEVIRENVDGKVVSTQVKE
ncbi:hypothetical protein LXL04_029435 [Taraxacum kok-saghyz]